ncbi:hypothetical protein CUC08_Gglean009471 [Alternaria sp. MG1]|nr:hypothetical protein CUC08_Gglean009471 [Alternaria sp. MG1]
MESLCQMFLAGLPPCRCIDTFSQFGLPCFIMDTCCPSTYPSMPNVFQFFLCSLCTARGCRWARIRWIKAETNDGQALACEGQHSSIGPTTGRGYIGTWPYV